jgi:N-acetylmuramoyl-L-alanine amidase
MTVIVHHAADKGPVNNTPRAERKYMRGIQDFHMGPSRDWNDIAYNYMIMPSGRVYEARGYGVTGAHAPGWNNKGIGVCFAGNGDVKPTEASIKAYNNLINRLESKSANITNAKPHGDVYPTSCPGVAIRKELGL